MSPKPPPSKNSRLDLGLESAEVRGVERVVRPAVVSAIAVVLLFGGFEIAEQLWLTSHLNMRTLHVLHLGRGLLAATLVGVIFAHSFRHWVRNLGMRRDWELTLTQSLRDREQLNRSYALWFTQMRWIAVGLLALLSFAATVIVPVLDHHRLVPLLAGVTVLAIGNMCFLRAAREERHTLYDMRVQMAFDLLVLTFLLNQSGGLENPLHLAYVFHVILACLLLRPTDVLVVVTASSLLLVGMAAGEYAGLFPHYLITLSPHEHHGGHVQHAAHNPSYVMGRVASAVALFYVLATLVLTIGRQLRRREDQLLAAVEQFETAHSRLRTVIDASRAGIGLLDAEGNWKWTNPLFENWFNPRSGEASDPSQAIDAVATIARKALANQSTVTQPFEMGPPGSATHFFIVASPVLTPQPMPQAVVVAQDITPIHTMQNQLIQAEKLAAIGTMAGRVAHEINNPVGIILAKTQLLQRKELPKQVSSELQKIGALAKRAVHIAGEILSLARPTSGPRSVVDIEPVIREAAELNLSHPKNGDLEIDLQLATQLPPVYVNTDELLQVLNNLIDNAADAIDRCGRVQLVSELLVREGKPVVAISVCDHGCGIPADQLPSLFDPFWTTKPPGHGTGLGLPIARRIARAFGGDIEVESAPTSGTIFRVLLPEASR